MNFSVNLVMFAWESLQCVIILSSAWMGLMNLPVVSLLSDKYNSKHVMRWYCLYLDSIVLIGSSPVCKITLILDLCGSETYLLSPGDMTDLKSPNYPGRYPPNLNCIWTLTASDGGYPTISFIDVSLSDSHDFLSIFALDRLVLEVRGVALPVSLTANTTTMVIDFLTWKYTFGSNKGFWLKIYRSEANCK